MNDIVAPTPSIAMAQPLSGIRFLHLGSSRAGRLLGDLLIQQGAVGLQRPLTDASPTTDTDVVIDDRIGPDTGEHDMERRRVANERLIWFKFTDFPRKHPSWTGRSRLVDELIHAELGLNCMTAGGELRTEPLAIASTYGAIWGALYIAAALRQRDETGRGSEIELPLFSAAMTVLGRRLVSFTDPNLGDPLDLPHLPLAEIFECGDGRHVQSHGTFANFAEILCNAFGREDWAAEAAGGIDRLPDREAEKMWRARFAEHFRQRPALAWEEAINALGGSCTMCRTRAEWLAEPHPRESGIVAAQDPLALGPAVNVASPAPDTASSALGKTSESRVWRQVAESDKALPLAGVRVVDLCIILAGPTCGRTLAELGADVIKIDAADRTISPLGWVDVNRAKRSLLLDLKQQAGRDIAHRLIMSSDVVLQNLRRGKLDKLGLGYEDIRRVRPDIIYGSLNAFDFGGRWSDRAGWEHNAQAITGMQIARSEGGVPQPVPVPVNDYATGLLGAYGVILALRQRQLTGVGAHVTGSLSRTGSLLQNDELTRVPADYPPTRVIQCTDQWIRFVDDHAAQTCGIGFDGLSELDGEEATTLLRSRGVTVTIERSLSEVKAGSWLDEAGLRWSWDHPHLGRMMQASAIASASGVPKRAGWPAPDRGDDTVAILTDLGFGSGEIDDMMSRGVVQGHVDTFFAAQPPTHS